MKTILSLVSRYLRRHSVPGTSSKFPVRRINWVTGNVLANTVHTCILPNSSFPVTVTTDTSCAISDSCVSLHMLMTPQDALDE